MWRLGTAESSPLSRGCSARAVIRRRPPSPPFPATRGSVPGAARKREPWMRSTTRIAGRRSKRSRHRARLRPGPSLRLDERQLEAIRVGERERPVSPGRVRRLPIERPALRLDPRGDRVDVLCGLDPHTESLALAAVPPLREVVLIEHGVTAARLHLNATHPARVLPALARREAEHVPVPGDAALQIVDGERYRQRAEA